MALILVVDDNEEFRRGVRRFLRSEGHQVAEAADGVAALQLVEARPVELVLTDINMPEMDGLELITKLKELRPALQSIAISGGGLLPSSLLLRNALMIGAFSTIKKPLELSDLQAAVNAALAENPTV